MKLLFTLVICLPCGAENAPSPKTWPEVLIIDDFENGLANWSNEDTGKLELVHDAPQGKKALRWTAGDDGIGHIVFKNLDRKKIDFSQYDLLMFRVKFEGKRIWNLNPIIQQYPAVYGYRGLYYSVDTLEKFNEWFVYTQDLHRWENAWPDTFDPEKQEFQFEVAQLAGAARTRVYLDDIKLVKNSLGVKKSYPGQWARLPDGSQVTHFRIRLRNRGQEPITVKAEIQAGTLKLFKAKIPAPLTSLLPGEDGEVFVAIAATAEIVAHSPRHYGETAVLALTVQETAGLTLFTELPAGTMPEQPQHPSILMTPGKMQALRKKWNDPVKRKELPRDFAIFVKLGEKALSYEPEYPPMAVAGRSKCTLDHTALKEIDVPNLPHHSYQCPKCGRYYSGPLYEAGMQGWSGKHLGNAAAARGLGFAYAITGRKEFALAAARILRAYIGRYLELPVSAPEPGSPVYSHTSGASRIGSTYMRERNWLQDLAIALDFIRPAKALSAEELEAISRKVFAPSAHLMMDHKVGAMNLQWMIASSGLYAGLAAENPGVIARAMYDGHGIVNLIEVGYLDDGNWWENSSYQNVANGIAFPVLATCINTGLLPWHPKLNRIFKAAYRMYGPDGRGPTLGTGYPGTYYYSNNAIHSLAGFVSDPGLAWVAYHFPVWQAWSGRGHPYPSYLWALTWRGKPRVPEDQTLSPIPDRTTNFPDYGGLALRVPGAGNYCYLHYGRELVHGHRNKLSVNAYARGGWFVRNTAGGYGDDFKNFLETIASSTSIMVDGQNPDADTGELLFLESGNGWEAASAREVGAWKEVEHERSVVLARDFLLVIDRCLADAEHTYDWLYHTSLTKLRLDAAGLQAPAGTRLGASPLYKSLVPLGQFRKIGPVNLSRKDGSGVQLLFTGEGELHSFRALKKWDGLLWRKKGKSVGFACVYFPHGKGEKVEGSLEALNLSEARGGKVGLAAGQAFRIMANGKSFIIMVNYSGKPLRCSALTSAKRVAVAVGP